MTGRIEKGIGGFYYVREMSGKLWECKARGVFRNENLRPLPGDLVELVPVDEARAEGTVTEVHARQNELVRPAVCNVDQAVIVFAAADPQPSFHLLDKFLLNMERQDLPSIVCFNKIDLAPEAPAKIARTYSGSGFRLCFLSTRTGEGIEELKTLLDGKMSVFAGPSGVGKSTLLNLLQPEAGMETGEISRKLKRGRHTTRHSELFWLWEDTFVMDTPGFTALDVEGIPSGALRNYYQEFLPLQPQCRFDDCIHIGERDCAVKKAVEERRISRKRYESYCMIYEELKESERY